jgi:hypothetical protein
MAGWISALTSIISVLYTVYRSPQFKALLAAAQAILASPELRSLFDELVELFKQRDPVFFEKTFSDPRYAPLREQTGLTPAMALTLASYAVSAQMSPCDDKCDEDCEHRAKELVVAAGLPPLEG